MLKTDAVKLKVREGAAPRRVTVLGSTGSVGSNTIDLIRRKRPAFAGGAPTASENVRALAKQARELGARRAVIADPSRYADLKDALRGSDVEAAAGPDAVIEAAAMPADWVMSAIVGAAGLKAT